MSDVEEKDFELELLNRIILDKDLKEVIRGKISSDFFFSPDTREIFNYLMGEYATHGTIPSYALVLESYPDFELVDPEDSMVLLCDHLRRKKLMNDLGAVLSRVTVATRDDPEEGLRIFKEAAVSLTATHSIGRDVDVTKVRHEVLNEYKMIKATEGILGIPYPWPVLNKATMGMHAGEFILLYARPKSLKCITQGQRVMLSDGSYPAIEDIPELGAKVPSFTEKTGKIRFANARRVVSGEKDCVEVITQSGFTLCSGDEHFYMVPGGEYRRICDLQPGDYVATVRELPEWKPSSDLTIEDAHFIGMVMGDGGWTTNSLTYTTQDPEMLNALIEHSERHGAEVHRCAGSDLHFRVTNTEGKKGPGANPVMNWLREVGVKQCKSNAKRVPETVFRASKDAIASFLAAMLDTDGHVRVTAPGRSASWATACKGLAYDIQHLLTRFGVRGSIDEVVTNFGTLAYNVHVYSAEQFRILWDAIGKFMRLDYKRDALRILSELQLKEKRNRDAIPYTDALLAAILKAKGGREWPKWGSERGSHFSVGKLFRRTNRISRALLLQLAKAFESEELFQAASTNIIWEQIESIRKIGRRPCFDICIEDGQDPNFVVEGFIVHNTWLLLHMALHAHGEMHKIPVVMTKEMPADQMRRRVIALYSGLDYKRYREGNLSDVEYARFEEDLADFESSPPFLICDCTATGIEALTEFRSKLEEYDADIGFFDGLYLLGDDPKELASITRGFKSMAKEMNIPLVGTTQATRGADRTRGESLTEIGYSDSFGQDADLVIRIIRESQHIENKELMLTLPGFREGEPVSFTINAFPAYDFTQKQYPDGGDDVILSESQLPVDEQVFRD